MSYPNSVASVKVSSSNSSLLEVSAAALPYISTFSPVPSPILLFGARAEPQLKSIYNSLKSVVLKKVEVKLNPEAAKILSIKYFNWMQGLKACSKEVSWGFPAIGPVGFVFWDIRNWCVQSIKGYFNVL